LHELRAWLFGDLVNSSLYPSHHAHGVSRLMPKQIALCDPHNDKAGQHHGSDQKEGETQQDLGSESWCEDLQGCHLVSI
jgi:hypothetical protein